MIEHVIQQHHPMCPNKGNCDNYNSNGVVLFVNNNFQYVKFHTCWSYFERDHDFVVRFLESMYKNTKVIGVDKWYSVNKSVKAISLKNDRHRQRMFKQRVYEVNFIYASASQTYYVCTEINAVDRVINNDELDTNYKNSLEYIKKYSDTYEYQYLKDTIDELFSRNYLYECDEYKIHKTLDELAKHIKQQ